MTQLIYSKKGEVTSEMKKVAKSERISEEKLLELLKKGQVVIPANKNHKKLKPIGIGRRMKTKINANIGASPGKFNLKAELEKLEVCEKYGADCVMDLSIGKGDLDKFRREMLRRTHLPFGTVPIYQAVSESSILDYDKKKLLEVIEKQAKDGVDFITVHAGFKREFLPYLKTRITGVVSRGGGFLQKWMQFHKKENPLLENFDEILEIARKYDVTLSLGDSLRPGSIHDSGDKAQFAELETLGKLVLRCRDAGVQVMVEGPGHVPIDEIEKQIKMQKKICHNVPFYVLGPLVCDIGAGYDHITSAIGGAIAAMHGADFLCYVTPSEHLGLPALDDVKEGIIASKIAAHTADIAKKIPGAKNIDLEMSKFRKSLNWTEQEKRSLDRGKFQKRCCHNKKKQGCTMCGKYCPMIVEGRGIRE